MNTLLINRAFHTRLADLSRSSPDGLVIGYAANGNPNQTWTTAGGVGGVTMINGAGAVAVGVLDAQVEAQVYGGGPLNNFVIELAHGGIRIRLEAPGAPLYWTLVDGLESTPVRLMPLSPDAPNTQIWNLGA